MHGTHGRRAGTLALIASLAAAGCGVGGTPSALPATAPPVVAPTIVPTVAATTTPATIVIEDVGVEVELVAGTYTSRLFTPALRLELGPGWYRRDSNSDRVLNLRRAADLENDVTFFSGPDFIQCGSDGELVEDPDGATIIAALEASPHLDLSEPVEVAVGALTGMEIRLAGGGEPVPDDKFMESLDYGCIASLGEAFPADSSWNMFMPDTVQQLILVEVDGTTVMVRGRPGEDREAWFDFVVEAAKGFHLG